MLCVGAVGAVPLPMCRQEHVFFWGGGAAPPAHLARAWLMGAFWGGGTSHLWLNLEKLPKWKELAGSLQCLTLKDPYGRERNQQVPILVAKNGQ